MRPDDLRKLVLQLEFPAYFRRERRLQAWRAQNMPIYLRK